ncbi:MAG: hypothetical protein AB7H43_15680 [Acidimicrobiia bacterium]
MTAALAPADVTVLAADGSTIEARHAGGNVTLLSRSIRGRGVVWGQALASRVTAPPAEHAAAVAAAVEDMAARPSDFVRWEITDKGVRS